MLEGAGEYEVFTGIRFLDHMLELFTKHGGFNLTALGQRRSCRSISITPLKMSGIVLGQLFNQALGDRKGINRAGYFVQTMDETLGRRRG